MSGSRNSNEHRHPGFELSWPLTGWLLWKKQRLPGSIPPESPANSCRAHWSCQLKPLMSLSLPHALVVSSSLLTLPMHSVPSHLKALTHVVSSAQNALSFPTVLNF